MDIFNFVAVLPILLCIPIAFVGVILEGLKIKKIGKLLQKIGAILALVVFFELGFLVFAAITENIGLIHWGIFDGQEEMERQEKIEREWRQYVVECIDRYSLEHPDAIKRIDNYIASEIKENNKSSRKIKSVKTLNSDDVISFSSYELDGYVTVIIAYKNVDRGVKVNIPYELLFFVEYGDNSYPDWEYFLLLIEGVK